MRYDDYKLATPDDESVCSCCGEPLNNAVGGMCQQCVEERKVDFEED